MMQRTATPKILGAALLGVGLVASALANGDPDSAARMRVYAQLADHNLLQIMLVVPTAPGKSNLAKTRDGGWELAGDVLCLDVSGLREEIDAREVRELPDEARRHPIAAGEFYRATRFDPPRIGAREDERDYSADLTAALQRFAAARFVKKVAVELNHGGAGCAPDAAAVPAIRFFKRAYGQPGQSAWVTRMERGDIVSLGLISVAEIKAARAQRLAAKPADHPAAARSTETSKASPAAAQETAYGALRIESGRFRICYEASDDPLPQLAAWALADSDKVKRWMSASPETPKAISDLDAILAEFRKPAGQRQCTLLVAATAVIGRAKAQLERERLTPVSFPDTASATQVLSAYGFRNVEELRFARAIGADSGELFAQLRALGLDHRAGYDQALRRYSWQYGAAKPDAEGLAQFVRDEREASARGMSVKALRAERAKREDAKVRKVSGV